MLAAHVWKFSLLVVVLEDPTSRVRPCGGKRCPALISEEVQALTLGLWVQWPGGPVDLKTYWPPKKLTGPGGQ